VSRSPDATIAAIMGWPIQAVIRAPKTGQVWASWFPINATRCVLYSGENRSSVAGHIPFSRALEEEYRVRGIPVEIQYPAKKA